MRPVSSKTLKTTVGLVVAAALVVASAQSAQATFGGPARKDLRCRYKIATSLMGLARKQMRIRSECAARQAAGFVNPTIDCLGDPGNGPGTGSASIDARLTEVAYRASVLGLRIGKRCDAPFRSPASIGMDRICDPAITDPHGWKQALECGYDAVTGSGDRLFALTYRRADEGSESMSAAEEYCRDKLSEYVRVSFRGRVRQRTDCFRRRDKRSLNLRCMATISPPGRVESTGYPVVDEALQRLFVDLRVAVKTACGDAVDSMRFTENSRIADFTASSPGGGSFTGEDLFNRLVDAVLTEETFILTTRMFPGQTYCGDGVVDWARGETCDDGNVESCDGCDRDCTITACQNGAACGPSEVCDDGNATLDDGCNDTCQFESCGDGQVQLGLGEGCDDSNAVDCDGCDSNCTVSSLCNNAVVCSAFGEECDDGLGICLSGYDERGRCVSDADCRGECTSGSTAGDPCSTNTDCSAAVGSVCVQSLGCGGICDGGANDRSLCDSDEACPGKCLPVTGQGAVCGTNADCAEGMRCNQSLTCELPRQGLACTTDGTCGTGGYCELSGGCFVGNSDELGDRCRNSCMLPTCGDGAADGTTDTNGLGGEACDDGNLVDGDGCDSNCTATACGNGIVTTGESCDLGPGACAGGLDDNAVCLSDSECRGFCFDHPTKECMPETAVIDCDGQACIASSGCVGGIASSNVCRQDCTVPACGDGILDSGEACDGADAAACPSVCQVDCTCP